MRFIVRAAAVWVLALGWLLPARAQQNWNSASSGTSQPLRAVAYGAGQFIAVGDAGMILTSPDGQSWTARPSGTSATLRGVALMETGFAVAVGDNNTILQSADGVTWRAALASLNGPTTSANFNAVVLDGPRFLVAGENGAHASATLDYPLLWWGETRVDGAAWRGLAFGRGHYVAVGTTGVTTDVTPATFYSVVTGAGSRTAVVFGRDEFVIASATGALHVSTDAATWTLAATLPGALGGIAYAAGHYVAVGAAGFIAYSDDVTTWTSAPPASAVTLHAVAGSADTFVAVGDNGTILRSTVIASVPVVLTPPVAQTEEAGGSVVFSVKASGTPPLSYQWLRNGSPIVGATSAILLLDHVTADQGGPYEVTVSNAAGSTTSPSATVTITPAGPRIVDAAFAPSPAFTAAPTALLPLADGTLLVAGGQSGLLQKLLSDGSLDPTFVTAQVDGVRRLLRAADRRIYVAGNFASVNGTPRPGLARLKTDGTLDTAFVPPDNLGSSATDVVELSDGKVVVVYQSVQLQNGLPTNAQVTRLLPTGAVDLDYEPFGVSYLSNGQRPPQFLAVAANDQVFALGTWLVRYTAGGAIDASFPARNVGFYPSALHVLANGDVALASYGAQFSSYSGLPLGPDWNRYLRHFAPDGSVTLAKDLISSSTSTAPPPASPAGWDAVYFYADGRAIIADEFEQIDGYARPGFARLKADGFLDLSFNPGVTPLEPITLVAVASDGKIYAGGSFNVYDGVERPHLVRLNVLASEGTHAPSLALLSPDRQTVVAGDSVTLHAAATGSGPLTYRWFQAGNTTPIAVTAVPDFTFTTSATRLALTYGDAGLYYVEVANTLGTITSSAVAVRVLAPPLAVTQQPDHVSVQAGRDLTLAVTFNDSLTLEYVWQHDGVTLSSSGASTLVVPAVTAAAAGTYTVTARRADESVATSAPIVVTVDDSSRFVNLSTRALAGANSQTLILGFVIDTAPGVERSLIIRGIGPALAGMGVASPLGDPRITVYNADGQALASNSGWNQSTLTAAQFSAVGAFPLEPGSKDAALAFTASQPGIYTVHLTSTTGNTGVALIELYENDNVAQRLTNVSTRAFVGTGENVAIPGLVVAGPVPKRLLVRAVGPTLIDQGVAGVLADPQLELVDEHGVVLAHNDNWGAGPEKAELVTAFAATGAFPLPDDSTDAALIITVPPGRYTAIASGVNDSTGVALVEVYELP